MAKKEILPAVEAYTADLASALNAKKSAVADPGCMYEQTLISRLSALTDRIYLATEELEQALIRLKAISDVTAAANNIRDEIIPKMALLRVPCDEAETLTAEKYWPFPTYEKLLFGVK